MKKIAIYFFILVMLFSFAGCEFGTEVEVIDPESIDKFFGHSSGDVLQKPETEGPRTFTTPEALSKYLNEQKEKNIFNISFYYNGDEEITPQEMAQMVSCFCISYSQGDEKNLHTIAITEYPGDRIVDAYSKNNEASLNAVERATLEKALSMLSVVKSKARNEWETELYIHDMLINHITYYDEEVEAEEMANATADTESDTEGLKSSPRFLTAVGALLDGKANCQGYTDAFYLLASLSGFEVGRMNVKAGDAPHVVNTILLNRNWYVVDVTFDDLGDDLGSSYRMFNAGLDQINELSWEPQNEIHKIAPFSSDYSYYIRKGLAFNNADDLAERIKEKWLAGQQTIKCVLRDETNGDVLKTALEKALKTSGKECSYNLWYYDDGKDLYYTVTIE